MLAFFAAALGDGPLLVSASPSSVSGSGFGIDTSTVTTNAASVSVSGGLPPYTYSWAIISGSTNILPTAPGAASTAFQRALLPVNGVETADFRCTVTDSLSRTAQTNLVTATVSNP